MLKIHGHRELISEEQADGVPPAFPSTTRYILVRAGMALPIEMISGNGILQPMCGHRKLTLREEEGWNPQDFPLAIKDIWVLAQIQFTIRISGSMTLLQMPGRRKPTLGE